MAAANDQPEICRELLHCSRFTLGVNAVNNQGATPLDFAVNFGDDHSAAAVLRDFGGEPGGQFGSWRAHRQTRMTRGLNAGHVQVGLADSTDSDVVDVDALD
eukprot:gnl/TRDRNA2_/TRDRNA2_83054_c0_seq1.p1 gnl/TRDRNA2_/TRDRNA2_83054_c0~~gnl/TRDRNA2_/TRDRNA2_83054_c0_seq1.p1  ORF type:complete len:102 (+),score=10.51 gnl/TRDRNA2_/TRDRNA2_83054_c0_seq1:120-425(+)